MQQPFFKPLQALSLSRNYPNSTERESSLPCTQQPGWLMSELRHCTRITIIFTQNGCVLCVVYCVVYCVSASRQIKSLWHQHNIFWTAQSSLLAVSDYKPGYNGC